MSSKRTRYERIALVERNAEEEEESSEEEEDAADSSSEEANDDTRIQPSNPRAAQQAAKQGKIHVALNKQSELVCHVRVSQPVEVSERTVSAQHAGSSSVWWSQQKGPTRPTRNRSSEANLLKRCNDQADGILLLLRRQSCRPLVRKSRRGRFCWCDIHGLPKHTMLSTIAFTYRCRHRLLL
eukprot:GHUV01033760.1.p1 GENE.GHUV01033760.1~~GHUV01033760.1.p1  ORF type:complete len:182 (+),score=25.12 GHUV01033760.1:320-865(+)